MAADINIAYNKYVTSTCNASLEDVVCSGVGIVRHFAALYGAGLDYDDLFQTGMVGLLRAAKSYSPDYGATFSTWAAACIISEIRHYVRRERTCAAEPCSMQEANVDTTVPNEKPEKLQVASPRGYIRLDDVEKEKDCHMQSFHLALEDKIMLEQAMKKLGDLQRKVLNAIYFRGLTQQQTAEELGISQRRVSRLKCASLSILRQLLDPASFHIVDNKKSFHYISGKKK